MATADGSILIKTKVDQAGIKTGTKGISAAFSKLAGAAGIAIGIAALAKFSKAAIKLGSGLTEVQNVVDTAFGEMSYKIEEFSSTSIEQFGLSELASKSMASTFMAMGTGMGQALDIGSDKAVELTGRLGDVGSFFNKTASQLDTIGRAIYSGETEPLKQLGIIMTEAQLQTFALANGYSQLYTDMDAANKLLVRQEYFLNATNLAAGDFAKTSGSWANQTRILTEYWKQFMTVVGNGLINVLKPVVTTLINIVSAMTRVATAIGQILGWTSEIGGTATTSIGSTADAESDLESATAGANEELKNQAAAFDKVNVLGSSGTSGSGGTSSSISTVADSTSEIEKGDSALSEFALQIEPLVTSLKNLFSAIGDFGGSFFKGFVGYFTDLISLDADTTAKGIQKLADAIGSIDEDQAETIGKAFAEIATAIVAIKLATSGTAKAIAFFESIKGVIIALGSTSLAAGLSSILSIMNPAMLPALFDFAYNNDVPIAGKLIGLFRDGWKEVDWMVEMHDFNDHLLESFLSSFSTIFTPTNILGFEWAKQIFDISGQAFSDVVTSFEKKDWAGVGKNLLIAIGGGILGVVTFVFEPIVKLVAGIVNMIISSINSVIEGVNTLTGSNTALLKYVDISVPDTSYYEKIYSMAGGYETPTNATFSKSSSSGMPTSAQTNYQSMQAASNNRNGMPTEIKTTMELDGQTFAKVATPYIINELNRTGNRFVTTGVQE